MYSEPYSPWTSSHNANPSDVNKNPSPSQLPMCISPQQLHLPQYQLQQSALGVHSHTSFQDFQSTVNDYGILASSSHQDVTNNTSEEYIKSDFSILKSNYMNMLSQQPDEEPISSEEQSAALNPAATPEDSLSAPSTFREYLTSPVDSPLPETPILIGADGIGVLTSPFPDDCDDAFGEFILFSHPVKEEASDCLSAESPANFENLYTMPSESPAELSTSVSPQLLRKRTPSATGTRQYSTPESLIPIDAPTQHREYKTTSLTSRKEVPLSFSRKRSKSDAFDGNMDQPGTLTSEEAALIEEKRRQNTIASRKSRKRKLEYIRNLENALEKLRKERDDWRARALTCQTILKYQGLSIPEL